MASGKSSEEYLSEDMVEVEKENLLGLGLISRTRRSFSLSLIHVLALYITNTALLFILFIILLEARNNALKDPTLGVWSPANSAVEYINQQHFRAALFNQTEYMGYPTNETDKLWSDLYNFGISKISEDEAKKLPSPTLPVPGTKNYLIELDVWHELHCLNDLRKMLYPERFPGLDQLKDENGVIDRNTDAFRHWDHCIDSLRQTIMCHADVAPIPFHVNVPSSKGIFPRLATTHTCRNFTKIQDWAKSHKAGYWDWSLTKAQAEEIVKTAGFDQSTEEDIEFLYYLFPGNTFFKYWREHSAE